LLRHTQSRLLLQGLIQNTVACDPENFSINRPGRLNLDRCFHYPIRGDHWRFSTNEKERKQKEILMRLSVQILEIAVVFLEVSSF
jgi:hypothetical protein